MVAPLDPRLPGGGGYTVGPIYNVNPDKFGVTDDYRTYSPAYGNVSQVYNGVDVSVNARLRNGLQVQAGTSTGQTVVDACEVRDKLPEQVSTGAASARAAFRTTRRTRSVTSRPASRRGSPPPARISFPSSTCRWPSR